MDYFFAEIRQHHPLVFFGDRANTIEKKLNIPASANVFTGFKAWALVVMPIVGLFLVLDSLSGDGIVHFMLSVIVLYFALGRQSLMQHAEAIIKPLQQFETLQRSSKKERPELNAAIDDARHQVSMIVSRDCTNLNEEEIIAAGTESVLENGADAIFAAIFWFCIAGIPGVVLYRLSNTLDAMWGYKNDRVMHFGKFAARFDDVMNFIPARLTALSYCLLAPVVQGSISTAYRCWQLQGAQWKSPNAGPVMAAGAGALQVSLGGVASYHGSMHFRPILGVEADRGRPLSAATLILACKLVNASAVLWLLILFLLV
ncbi:MAG: cobalamin biosynthesis protein CobD [Pseudomonadales bacterium]|nr:cobalamin biosynthesis protein CobD [Pseudomonadales bacterium]